MDAYAPVLDTLAPPVATEVGNLWQPFRVTGGHFLVECSSEKARPGLMASDPWDRTPTFTLLRAPALAGLDRLRSFKQFREGWDAEQGHQPDPAAIDTATKVYSLVALHDVPQVTLNSLGQPMLIFNGQRRGEIVISSSNEIDYFFDDDDAPFGDQVPFNGRLPHELATYLSA